MLLTFSDFDFLERTTVDDKDGKLLAKENLSKADKERLLALDELNYMTSEEHLISNFKELEK